MVIRFSTISYGGCHDSLYVNLLYLGTRRNQSLCSSARRSLALSIPGGNRPKKIKVLAQGQMYPKSMPLSAGYLKVSSLHTIYYEIFGNPQGKPVVFLHGGPGASCSRRHAQFFDPKHYRVVLFDQRGCGKSVPLNCLEENTTWHLVNDIEKLREHLGIKKWIVTGGSWGVTLGLAYAETYPHVVAGIILRGVSLLRQQELDWFYKQGANLLYPFAWERFLSVLEPGETHDILGSYYRRLTSDNPLEQLYAANAWFSWEMELSSFSVSSSVISYDGQRAIRSQEFKPLDNFQQTLLKPLENLQQRFLNTGKPIVTSQVVQARLECHYFINQGFLTENQLLKGVSSIQHIPCTIIHGRYDFVCPLSNAFDLHRAWPEADLRIVMDAGHSMYEKGIAKELVNASDKFRSLNY